MIDGLIVKRWGAMAPVTDWDIEGEVDGPEMPLTYVAKFTDTSNRTSIHRHECWSHILCVEGAVIICVSATEQVIMSSGDRVAIPPGMWHRVSASNGAILVEDYDTDEDDYPIERYEGEGWPDE
jgi:quercetin dioxygenase-like cupin family protein